MKKIRKGLAVAEGNKGSFIDLSHLGGTRGKGEGKLFMKKWEET